MTEDNIYSAPSRPHKRQCLTCKRLARPKARTIAERLLALVKVLDDGCWEWQGRRIWNGYGRIGYQKRQQLAHRVSYETFVCPIPEGLQMDHLCRNRACVNPAHLEPVTPSENSIRRYARAREDMAAA